MPTSLAQRILGPADCPWDLRNRAPLAGFLVVLIVCLSIAYPEFRGGGNVQGLLLSMTATGIAAIGTTVLVISRNIDLSIGGQYAIVSIIAAMAARDSQSATVTVVVAVGLGALLGCCNGVLVRALKINPLIVTLAAASILRGLAYVVSSGRSITGFPPTLLVLGRGQVMGLPIPVLIGMVLFVVASFILVRTVLGIRIYAIGGNPDAATLSGLRATRYVTALYAFNGALIGVVATLSIARLGSASPAIGTNFELDVLTAVLLGGVAFAGGAGNVLGVALGVATIVVIGAGIVFVGVPDFWQQVTSGAVLLASLIGDQVSSSRRERVPKGSAGADEPEAPRESKEAIALAVLAPKEPVRVDESYALECGGLSKRFGTVRAVSDVGFKVRPGEVVCLVGDNGAGKSTTIKMLSGAVKPDSGWIRIAGKPVSSYSPGVVRDAGVSTVYQDLALCSNLGAAHNLTLGREPTRLNFGLLSIRDDAQAVQAAQERLSRLGVKLEDALRPIRHLSGGQRQSVAIARADQNRGCVILDEPTAALGVRQTRNVLCLIRTLASRGVGVVLISHDMESIFEIADSIVVLRHGAVVWEGPRSELTRLSLVHLMAGFAANTVTVSSVRPVAR
jgi:ribose/xylose/arabinose/galactoside ABC-type transport system permease subunit/ABC-type multidrug transport system ATPase subunit